MSPSEALKLVLAALDRLEISYLVGGSLASSVYGVQRSTLDADLVADIGIAQTQGFADELKSEFYADAEMMKEALQRGRSFNLIHYASGFKVDIFPLGADEYSQTQFKRRRFQELHTGDGAPIECAVGSAEDTILNKLLWYRAGGESSERQWSDLLGILQMSGTKIDREYLDHWAGKLNLADLLERLLRES